MPRYSDLKKAIIKDGRFLNKHEDESDERWFWSGVAAVVQIESAMSSNAVLGEVPNITDENTQELREIILDSGSSKNYQNKKIREWFVRHFA